MTKHTYTSPIAEEIKCITSVILDGSGSTPDSRPGIPNNPGAAPARRVGTLRTIGSLNSIGSVRSIGTVK